MAHLYPRPIAPELIEPGDDITVTYVELSGIVMSKRGIVERIDAHGAIRYLLTAERGQLGTFQPGARSGTKFTLNARKYEREMLPLFTEDARV